MTDTHLISGLRRERDACNTNAFESGSTYHQLSDNTKEEI